jgi:hypothetical protein
VALTRRAISFKHHSDIIRSHTGPDISGVAAKFLVRRDSTGDDTFRTRREDSTYDCHSDHHCDDVRPIRNARAKENDYSMDICPPVDPTQRLIVPL